MHKAREARNKRIAARQAKKDREAAIVPLTVAFIVILLACMPVFFIG